MRNYQIEVSRHAEKILAEMAQRQPEIFSRVKNALDELAQNPFQGKPLKGKLKNRFSYRVGSYRIVYSIFHEKLIIYVINVGHRRDIYR